jgi:hypothetical protein
MSFQKDLLPHSSRKKYKPSERRQTIEMQVEDTVVRGRGGDNK